MSEMQFSTHPAGPGDTSPRPFSEIPGLWVKFTQMTEAFFAQEAPRASGSSTLISILIYAVIIAILTALSTLVSNSVCQGYSQSCIIVILAALSTLVSGGREMAGMLSEPGDTAIPTVEGTVMCSACFGLVGTLLLFYMLQGSNYLVARLLGGTGNFVTQAYLTSLFYVPLGVVSGLVSLVPYVGSLVSFAVSIYIIALSVRAIKVVHQLTTGRAVVAILWPLPLILLAICVIAVLLVPFAYNFFRGCGKGRIR